MNEEFSLLTIFEVVPPYAENVWYLVNHVEMEELTRHLQKHTTSEFSPPTIHYTFKQAIHPSNLTHKYDRPIDPWAVWTQGGLSYRPNTPWVLICLRTMRYFSKLGFSLS